ncbi:MAG: NYN domain-containing protein [Leptospirales bacterium]|nr:NYN domain-containing protein [Leptospirales bacterium]
MGILIDGFNLIYKFPELEELMYAGKLNEARKGLLDILKEYHAIKPVHIRVVFDGKKNQGDNLYQETIGPFTIYYSHDFSADHLIKEFVKGDMNPRMMKIVTSDNHIISYVSRFHAAVIKSEDFAEQVKSAIEKSISENQPEKDTNPTLSEEELAYWETVFKKKT